MQASSSEKESTLSVYSFGGTSSAGRGLRSVLAARDPLFSILSLIQLLVGAGFLFISSQQPRHWQITLGLGLALAVWASWHYLRLVCEVRVAPQYLSVRQLTDFRSIPWAEISRVRVYSLRTTGNTYIILRGHSKLPLALLPLWVPWWRPESWEELSRLVEDIARHVPAKHSW